MRGFFVKILFYILFFDFALINQKAINSYNEGLELSNLGKHQKASKLFERAIKLQPSFFQAHTSLAISYEALELLSKALKHIQIADKLAPNNPIILTNFGNILRGLKQYKTAENKYQLALKLNPQYKLAAFNMAILLAENNEFENVRSLVEDKISTPLDSLMLFYTLYKKIINPGNEVFKEKYKRYTIKSLVSLSMSTSNWQQMLIAEFLKNNAKSCLISEFIEFVLSTNYLIIKSKPLMYSLLEKLPSIPGCSEAGKLLQVRKEIDNGNTDTAIDILEGLVSSNKNLSAMLYLIDTYYWRSDIEKAEKILKQKQKIDRTKSSYFEICRYFSDHDFTKGWESYLELQAFKDVRDAIPGGSIENIKNSQNLLVYGNQGIGDQIMFLSSIEKLLSFTNAKVFLKVDKRLVELIKRSFPNVFPLATISVDQESNFDCKILLEDVCAISYQSLNDFGKGNAFLKPNQSYYDYYKEALKKQSSNRLNIGFSWKGGNTLGSTLLMKTKSSELEDFIPLLQMPNINWVNLQYGDVTADIDSLREKHNVSITNFTEINPLDEIERQVALIANLDLVIQVSNASAHMAGAVGTPVWTLLGNPPDWRWFKGLDSEVTPWYSSMTLIRKKANENWSSTIDRVKDRLSNLAAI